MAGVKVVQLERFGDPKDGVRVVELPREALKDGEARVRVLAAAIHPSDVLTLRGQYGLLPELPAVPGNEGVGEVVEAQGDVGGLAVGQRVLLPMGVGTWRSELVAPARRLVPVPGDADVQQLAVALINPATAELLLEEAGPLEQGSWVLQNVANSNVGRALVLLAREKGLRTLNVVRRLGLEAELTALGADHVLVDGDDLPTRVRELTQGQLPRLALDAVGGGATARLGASVAPGGKVVCYGMMSGKAPALGPADVIFRGVTLSGFWLVRWMQHAPAGAARALFGRMVALVARGELRVPIDATFPLERALEAFARAEAGGRGGKVLFVP